MPRYKAQIPASKLNPSQLLDQILKSGRISKLEFDNSHASLRYEYRNLATHVPGNISLYGLAPASQLKAISQALNTPELLEQILVNLSTVQLLVTNAFHVCKGFRYAITTSMQFRRTAFIEPDPAGPTTWLPYLVQSCNGFDTYWTVNEFERGCSFTIDPTSYRQLRSYWDISHSLIVQPPVHEVRIVAIVPI